MHTIAMIGSFALFLSTPTQEMRAGDSNLGAIPAHLAIRAAEEEIGDDAVNLIWMDAGIVPMHAGWCVALTGINRHDGTASKFPVFVQQNGRAWRTDPAADAIYDGGADGFYMPPRWAADCKLEAVPPLPAK